MGTSIFFRELRQRWRSTFIWFLSLFLMTMLVIWIFGSVDVGSYEQLVGQYPKELEALFGEFSKISTPEGFLNAEVFSYLPILLAVLTIGYGSSVLSKEEESGTIELILASPISRLSILAQKILALVVIVAVISSSILLSALVGKLGFDFEISLMNTFLACVSSVLVSLIFGFFALAITAVTSKRGLSIGLAALFTAVSYFTNAFSVLIESLEPMKYFSLFYYYDSQNTLNGDINWLFLLLLAVITLILPVLSYFGFKNRDIGV